MKSTDQATRVHFTPVLAHSRRSPETVEQPNSAEFTWIESGWFSAIAQQSQDLIGAVSLTGDWLCLNPGGRAILAIDSPPPLTEMLNEATHALWHQTILAQVMECNHWRGQIALIRQSETIWFESQWFLIRDQYTNQPVGIGTIAHPIAPPALDCTLIEQALEQEKDQHQQKAQFLADAAHDLKTPLAVISTSIDLLNSDRLASDRKQKHFQRMRSKVRQMAQVLDNILILSRGNNAEIELQPTEIDPIRFCAEVLEEAQMTTDRHKIMFSADSSLPSIEIDPEPLQRILANLLSNSIKYSPSGGTIDCQVSVAASHLNLQVQDSGIGIPIAEQSQLFRSFYRASNAGTISGNGLGLAIVKKCVDRLHGQISVESVVQVGTCFTVTIPLRTSKPDSTSE